MPKFEDLHSVLQKHMHENQIATNRKCENSATTNNYDDEDGDLSKEEFKAPTIENADNDTNDGMSINDDNELK